MTNIILNFWNGYQILNVSELFEKCTLYIALCKIVYLTFLGNVVWLDDRMPTKALLDMTRPIRELKHITSVVDNEINREGEYPNDDYMEQDDVKAH